MGTGLSPRRGATGNLGVGLTPPHPHLVPKVLEKNTAIPLLTLRACVAYKKGEKPTYISNKSCKNVHYSKSVYKTCMYCNNYMKNVTTAEIELARLHSTHSTHMEHT